MSSRDIDHPDTSVGWIDEAIAAQEEDLDRMRMGTARAHLSCHPDR